MRLNIKARRAYVAPALGLVLVTAMSACSNSSSSSSSSASTASSTPASSAPATSASPAASGSSSAVSQIETNWNTFFNSSTPNSKRVQLLQNGSTYASAISSLTANPLAAGVGSKVDSVKLISATQATVTYDITLAGKAVASNQTGTSVLQDGVWKVGDSAFCGLLTEAGAALNEKVPAACSSSAS